MFHAIWRDGREMTSASKVMELASELGLAGVAGGLEDPAIKAQLKADTDAAARRGAFGAPTFFVGKEMFWGHDRLHHVARAVELAGGD
jgi:2-hydroxychromene-2-carboxylate isomerase